MITPFVIPLNCNTEILKNTCAYEIQYIANQSISEKIASELRRSRCLEGNTVVQAGHVNYLCEVKKEQDEERIRKAKIK